MLLLKNVCVDVIKCRILIIENLGSIVLAWQQDSDESIVLHGPWVMDSNNEVLICVVTDGAVDNCGILLANAPLDPLGAIFDGYSSICLESSHNLLLVGDVTNVLCFL
jgi:hypothetical protein